MPHLPVPPIPVPGVTKEKILHDLGQLNPPNSNQMMDMVSHQYIGIQTIPKPPSRLLEQPQVAAAIGVIPKDPLTPIPPADHMVETPGKMNPWLSGHAGILRQPASNVNKACLTPL